MSFFIGRAYDGTFNTVDDQMYQPRLLPGVAGLEDVASTDFVVALRDDQDTGAHNRVIAGIRWMNVTDSPITGPVAATLSCRRYASTIPVVDPYLL